jgi:hypothetical protein
MRCECEVWDDTGWHKQRCSRNARWRIFITDKSPGVKTLPWIPGNKVVAGVCGTHKNMLIKHGKIFTEIACDAELLNGETP